MYELGLEVEAMITVERLPGERILIATQIGEITYEEIIEMFRQCQQLIGNDPGVFHRITDNRQATFSFTEALKLFDRATQELPASTWSPQIRVTFVGTSNWITFFRNTLATRGIQISAFTTLEAALESARLQLAHENNPTFSP